uniref:NADH dehydrogenase subunit 1 n=1 Tax=Plegadiphilus threskiornis TaxID=2965265 RepID=UPI0026E21478|nr:NADH dehydrogenase subunit 1 [Plegadiphilus threskiornis]WIM51529.1 NADH dehydrogenase subunit 1 [Plegadiphilus threskiornis]
METLSNIVMFTQLLVLMVMIMICVAFFSLMERKILSYIHFRKGPNKVMIMGFFQPFADAMKLISKDDSPVKWSNSVSYYLSPLFMMFLGLISWWIFPFNWKTYSNNSSLLFIILILGMTIYGILISGWSSNSKYATLGSMRSISQSISYEVLMSFVFLSLISVISSYSISKMYDYTMSKIIMMMPFMMLLLMISALAELNRSPFDLSEGESELVSGYSVEYGGIVYTLIFLSENIMIFFSSFILSFVCVPYNTMIGVVLFSGFTFLICVIRGIVPRMRYDILMNLCWVYLLPLTLILFNFNIMMEML